MHELDDHTDSEVQRYAREGDALAEDGEYAEAIKVYNRAWELLPEPKNDWNAATWLLAAIGDSAFLGGMLDAARRAFDYAMTCPDAIGNPFLHLRRGQVLFDQGELDASADELTRAYAMAGNELFAQEDPKYLAFLGTRANLDSGGKKGRFRRR